MPATWQEMVRGSTREDTLAEVGGDNGESATREQDLRVEVQR